MWALEHGRSISGGLSTSGGTVTLTLSGELDLTTREAVADLADRALANAGSAPGLDLAVIDLADVTFIDCAGASELLALHRQLAERAIAMAIRRPSVPVQRLLSLVDLRWLIDARAQQGARAPVPERLAG